MGAPRAWTGVSGQDASGRATTIVGQEALRTVYYDPTFARISVDTSTTPPRLVVTSASPTLSADLAALTARVAALEALLASTGTVTIDRLRVKTIEAYSPGTLPNTLSIVGLNGGVDEEIAHFQSRGLADLVPGTKLSFFGASSNPRFALAPGYTTADVADALTNFGLVTQS